MADVSNDTVVATGPAATPARPLAERFAELVNVQDFGAPSNANAFSQANSYATANGKTLFVPPLSPPGVYNISASITITAPMMLAPGAIVKPASGVTVTLTNMPCAECVKIFDISAGGTINLLANGEVLVDWWGPAGDGIINDTLPLQAALNAAGGSSAGVPYGKTLVFSNALKYALSNSLTVRDGTRIRNSGATFVVKYSTGPTVPAVIAGKDVRADLLKFEVASGYVVNRVLRLSTGCHVAEVNITSQDQQATTGDMMHGALQIWGDTGTVAADVCVEVTRIRNFNQALVVWNASNVSLGQVDIASYGCGILVRNSHRTTIRSANIYTRSPSATQVAGNCGVVLYDVSRVFLSNIVISEPGDVGIWAISSTGVNLSDFNFSNLLVRRPGNGGVKIAPTPGWRAYNIAINGIMVIDCAYNQSPVAGEDAMILIACTNVSITGLHVSKRDNSGYSAWRGIFMSGCQFVSIASPFIQDTRAHAIHMYGDDSSVSTPLKAIQVTNPTLLLTAMPLAANTYGIYVQSNSKAISDIVGSACHIRGGFSSTNGMSYGVRVEVNSSTAGVDKPCVFQGWVRNGTWSGNIFSKNTSSNKLKNYMVQV